LFIIFPTINKNKKWITLKKLRIQIEISLLIGEIVNNDKDPVYVKRLSKNE